MSKISIAKKRGEILAPNFTTPFFCPRCEELRNVDPETEATGLTTPHESLMFKSFGMCTQCYRLSKEHPEQIEVNKQEFKRKLAEKEQRLAEQIKAKRFRLWIEGDYQKYVESITDKAFFSFTINDQSHKCKELLTKEEAERFAQIIKDKFIKVWIEEETV